MLTLGTPLHTKAVQFRFGFLPKPRKQASLRAEWCRCLLQLHALAYNLGNFPRTLATPELIKDWSLTTSKDNHVLS